MQTASAPRNVKNSSRECANKPLTLFAFRKQKPNYIDLIPPFCPTTSIMMHEKKGYSGLALYCKNQPDKIINGIG